MSRMRITAAQILAGCPLVIGFGGWGIRGAELIATGDSGPSIAYQWFEAGDEDKEFWVYRTSGPTAGDLYVHPDVTFLYDGPGGTAEFQLVVDSVPFGTPQTITFAAGSSHQVTPASAAVASSSSPASVQQTHLVAPGNATVSATSSPTSITTSSASLVSPANASVSSSSSPASIAQTHLVAPAGGSVSIASSPASVESGALTSYVSPVGGSVSSSSSAAGIVQTHRMSPASAGVQMSSSPCAVGQTHRVAPMSGAVQIQSSPAGLRLPAGLLPTKPLTARVSVLMLSASMEAMVLTARAE